MSLLQKGGLGAQKVKTNFTEIENRAQQIDKDKELMAANKAQEQAKTKEEQEKQMYDKKKNNEPPHEKSSKICMCPAKTQISLGIRPVWSESSLCAEWVAEDPSFLHADSEDTDQWVDAQADLSLCWAHMPFCWFCHELAQSKIRQQKLIQ